MKVVLYLILLFSTSCRSYDSDSAIIEGQIDYFVIYSTLNLVNTSPIPCDNNDDLTKRKIGKKFIINNKNEINEIFSQVKDLKISLETEPLSSTFIMLGYKKNKEVFKMCTTSRLTTDYYISGKRYNLNPKLNSILASVILKKFKEKDFTCTNENEDCEKTKENLFLMEKDYKVISSVLKPLLGNGSN